LGPILLLGEFLRLPYLIHPWLKDQAAIHAVVADIVDGRAHTAFPMPYTTTAFHQFLGTLFGLLGEGILLPRLLAASLAAATTVATWVLARRLFGHTAAIFAAALTATSPLLLSTPAVGLPNDPLLLLLSLIALHAALIRRSAPLAGLAAAILAGGMYVRFFYAPALALFGVLCLFLAPKGHRFRLTGAYAVAGGLLLVPMSWMLLGTDDGVAVVRFVQESVTGSSTMHTAMGEAMGTPVLQRTSESVTTVHQILLGRMNVGGLMRSAGANWVGLATGLLGLGLAMLRGLRPRPGRAMDDRFLLGWALGAFAILVLVVAWPSEINDASLGPYRAPRYFILLFPAPWIAAGSFVDLLVRRLDARPRAVAVIGLGFLVAIPASPMGSVALLTGRMGRVVTEARDVTSGLVQAVVAQTGSPPVVLADVPPGDVFNWRKPRFALRYDGFIDELSGAEDWAAWRQDRRLGLAMAYSQMLYQVQPDLYELELALGGHEMPARINLLDLPFPPIGPVLRGSEGVGEAVPHVVVVSSSPGAPILQQRVPGAHPDKRIDRITRFERLNPDLQRVVTVAGRTQPAYAFYRLDLQERVWSNLQVRFGLPDQALREPDRVWAFADTLFRRELGYGFSHGLLEIGTWRNAGQGLLPRYPVTFDVRVPEGGVYEGHVTVGRGCQSPSGQVLIGDRALKAEPDARCNQDANVIWLPERFNFCAEAVDGVVSLRFLPRPQWTSPWLIEELHLRRADGTPDPLRLGGCGPDLKALPAGPSSAVGALGSLPGLAPEVVAVEDPSSRDSTGLPATEPIVANADAGLPHQGRALVLLASRAAELLDPARDPPTLHPRDDLRGAHAIADATALYARVVLSEPPVRPIRFWVEQEPDMVMIEARVGDPNRRCDVVPVAGGKSVDVPGCFWLGPTGLDLQVPLDALTTIDSTRPFWVSGFQTCCRDAGREVAWDAIEGAQQVWRVP
jgi:4-amino-4-deoxy-L-arabinose transferase-like glycosyltransferase